MIPATMFKHIHLTASQRAEDRACPDGVEEVERCECGEIANHSHQVQVKFSDPPRDETINFCDECEAIAAEIIGEIEFRAAAMVKDGAD